MSCSLDLLCAMLARVDPVYANEPPKPVNDRLGGGAIDKSLLFFLFIVFLSGATQNPVDPQIMTDKLQAVDS